MYPLLIVGIAIEEPCPGQRYWQLIGCLRRTERFHRQRRRLAAPPVQRANSLQQVGREWALEVSQGQEPVGKGPDKRSNTGFNTAFHHNRGRRFALTRGSL